MIMNLHPPFLRWTRFGALAALSAVAAAHVVDLGRAPEPPGIVTIVHANTPDLPLETLVGAASEIVYGRILDRTPVVPLTGAAFTTYEVEVFSSLTGSSEERRTFRVGGAMENGRRTLVPGAPHRFRA